FLMGITGPQWSFPWYRTALQKTLGTYEDRKGGQERGGRGSENQNAAVQCQENEVAVAPLSIETYLSSADIVLPYEGNYRVRISPDSPIEISKNRVGFFAP